MTSRNHKKTSIGREISRYVFGLGPAGFTAYSKQAIQFRKRATSAILPPLLTACVVMSAMLLFAAYFWPTTSFGQTITEITNCRTISQSGAYVLADSFSYTAASQPEQGVCIIISASDVTLDGNGKTITVVGTAANGQFAVDVRDLGGSHAWNNILVENLNSNTVVRAFGPTIHHVTFDRLNVYGVKVIGADDVAITNNTLASGAVSVDRNDNDDESWVPYRPVIRNNVISGDAGWMFEVSGTSWNTTVCPNVSAVVDGNTITNNFTGSQADSYTFRIRCATHSTVTNNVVRVTGPSMGLYLRDESDDGVYTNNTFITTTKKAIHIGSGNVNKTFPARNIFRNNIFSTSGTYAAYLLGLGGGNQFIDNVFYSHSDLGSPNGDTILAEIGTEFGDTFDHNTFYADGTGAAVMSLANGGSGGLPTTFTNNIFSYNSAQAVWQYDSFPRSKYSGDYNLFNNRSGAPVSFGNYGANLAAWSAGIPISDTLSISGNPQFVSAATGDYSLAANSIGHNAAADGTDIGARNVLGVVACTENWSCGSWNACSNGQQARTCTDANVCGTTTNRPVLTQSCTMPCVESWSCGSWSACANGQQTRTCADANACGATASRPSLTQSCSVACVENWSCGSWSICENGRQTRTCADSNSCGTITSRPVISQACTSACTENWECGDWSECVNSLQTRTCADLHICNTIALRPALTQACTVAEPNPQPNNPGPLTAITSPSGKRVVGGQIAVKATAKDSNGVARVNFFIDGNQFGSDTKAAYGAILETRTLVNGRHIITVQAYDKLGAMTSVERAVAVYNRLYVRWSNPATRGIIRGSVMLQPRLIYGGTGTSAIEYFIDRKPYKTAQEKPYGVTWDSRSVRNGVHRFSIRVTDNNGHQATHVLNLRVLN